MAKVNTYAYTDPNAGFVGRSAQGDSYSIFAYGVCTSGQAIKIYDGATEVLFSCYTVGSLTITPLPVAANEKYDCINGGCIPTRTYNTPGAYANLADCQGGCAKNSICTGECVSTDELAALTQATSKLQSKFCG
jgi:hypothetical protein